MAGLKPVYLIVGADRPKVARALARLRGRFDDGAVDRLSAREAGGEEVVAACNALGLFADGARLVIVDEVERWKAGDVEAVGSYLADPAPQTVLALVGAAKPDGPLGRIARKRGEVLAYDVAKRKLPAWVGEQFDRLGTRADPAACRLLIELAGEDLDELATEVDKLATWAAGDQVTAADVAALVAPRADASAFALTDAWGSRDLPAVLRACEELLERSHRPRRDELPRVAGLLGSHVARVRACRQLAAEGVRPRDAAARLKQHPFAVEKAFRHAERYGREELRDVALALAELDFALKGGSRIPGDLELERVLVAATTETAGSGPDAA